MTDQEAREILKKHCAAYGDSKYEPAMWVIEALQDAVKAEREACADMLIGWVDIHEKGLINHDLLFDAANAIRERSNTKQGEMK